MGWMFALGVLGLIVTVVIKKITKRGEAASDKAGRRQQHGDSGEGPVVIEVYSSIKQTASPNIVEIVNDEGIPEFKYRFRANLGFDSPAEALHKHGQEAFIPRPNGNRDAITEQGGHWVAVSEWEDLEIHQHFEEEPFKYIGGSKVYIGFLLTVRDVYEDKRLSPSQKAEAIEKICLDSHNVYTVRHVYSPPWETLLIPVLSLAEGFGPHRISLLHGAEIRSVADLNARSDGELLKIKGIGKAAVSSLRNLCTQWPYDPDTEIIEKDEEFRASVALMYSRPKTEAEEFSV